MESVKLRMFKAIQQDPILNISTGAMTSGAQIDVKDL